MKNMGSLSGGGFKSAYFVGAFKALNEKNIKFDGICGTSGGALVGSLVAMGKFDVLEDLWIEVGRTNGANIFSPELVELSETGSVKINVDRVEDKILSGFDIWDKIKLLTKKGRQKFIDRAANNAKSIESLMSNMPLYDILLKHVKEADFKSDFYFTLVSLETGSLYTVSHKSFMTDSDLCLAILASSTIPILLKPIPKIQLKDGSYIYSACDGGIRANSPVKIAFQNINTSFDWNVWSFSLNSIAQPLNKEPKTLLTQAGLTVDALLNQNFTNDVKMSEKINQWSLKYPEFAKGENIVYAKLHNIECPVDKDNINLLGSTLDARAETINSRIQIGYDVMSKYLTENYV